MINPKKLLIKNIIMFCLFVLCAVLCVIFHKMEAPYVGAIAGGMAAIVYNLIRGLKLMKNEEYKKQAEIDAKDERTLMLNSKTSEITGFVVLMICCIGGIISIVLDKIDYLLIFGGIVLIHSLIYYVTRFILNKKY